MTAPRLEILQRHLRRASAPTREALRQLQEAAQGPAASLLDMVRRHFCDPGFRVVDARRSLGASTWDLTVCRVELGLSPRALVRECRMETASRLLRDTSLGVSEVTTLVGYETQSTLIRLCRDWCGLTPASYRKRLRRLRGALEALDENVVAWWYWERCRRGELPMGDVRRLFEFLLDLYGRETT